MEVKSPDQLRRLFVGGLSCDVTPDELKERFGRYGVIGSVDIRTKKNESGDPINTFAFLDVGGSPQAINECISVYNNTKWKGKVMKLQLAKESFLDRLAEERKNNSVVKQWSPPSVAKDHEKVKDIKVKGPPGTVVENMTNWVVGKYGRVLPVLNIRKKDKSKTFKFDPSKYCHSLQNYENSKTVAGFEPKIEQLTWQLESRKETTPLKKLRDSSSDDSSSSDSSDDDSKKKSGKVKVNRKSKKSAEKEMLKKKLKGSSSDDSSSSDSSDDDSKKKSGKLEVNRKYNKTAEKELSTKKLRDSSSDDSSSSDSSDDDSKKKSGKVEVNRKYNKTAEKELSTKKLRDSSSDDLSSSDSSDDDSKKKSGKREVNKKSAESAEVNRKSAKSAEKEMSTKKLKDTSSDDSSSSDSSDDGSRKKSRKVEVNQKSKKTAEKEMSMKKLKVSSSDNSSSSDSSDDDDSEKKSRKVEMNQKSKKTAEKEMSTKKRDRRSDDSSSSDSSDDDSKKKSRKVEVNRKSKKSAEKEMLTRKLKGSRSDDSSSSDSSDDDDSEKKSRKVEMNQKSKKSAEKEMSTKKRDRSSDDSSSSDSSDDDSKKKSRKVEVNRKSKKSAEKEMLTKKLKGSRSDDSSSSDSSDDDSKKKLRRVEVNQKSNDSKDDVETHKNESKKTGNKKRKFSDADDDVVNMDNKMNKKLNLDESSVDTGILKGKKSPKKVKMDESAKAPASSSKSPKSLEVVDFSVDESDSDCSVKSSDTAEIIASLSGKKVKNNEDSIIKSKKNYDFDEFSDGEAYKSMDSSESEQSSHDDSDKDDSEDDDSDDDDSDDDDIFDKLQKGTIDSVVKANKVGTNDASSQKTKKLEMVSGKQRENSNVKENIVSEIKNKNKENKTESPEILIAVDGKNVKEKNEDRRSVAVKSKSVAGKTVDEECSDRGNAGNPAAVETDEVLAAEGDRSTSNKKELSNQKRLESLKSKKDNRLQQQSIVRLSLTNPTENKKLIYDSDSESEKMPPEKKLKLFHEEDSSDEDVAKDQFRLRPEFEGTAGKKLFKLQSKIKDARFKLDERFIDEDHSDSEDEKEEKEKIVFEQNLKESEEKQKMIKILGSVVKLKQRQTPKFVDMESLRYDPSRPGHEKFEIKESVDDQKKAPKKPSVSEVQSKPAMLVSDERFFQVDSTLADAFKETETKVFTLTSMFDDDDDVVPQTETQTVLHTAVEPHKILDFFSRDEECDEHSDGEEHPIESTSEPTEKTFFFQENDARIINHNFYRTEDLSTIRKEWLEARPELIKAYQMRRKRHRVDATRNKRNFSKH